MQALSICPTTGELWVVPKFDIELGPLCLSTPFRERRRKRFYLGGSSSVKHGRLDLRCGFFFGYSKCKDLMLSDPKRGFFGAFALAWALEEQGMENGPIEENSAGGFADRIKEEGLDCSSDEKLDSGIPEVNERKRNRVNVRGLASSLLCAKTTDDVQEILKDSDELPLQVYSSIIKGFGRDKKLDSAMLLMEWLKRRKKESDGFDGPNSFVYNSLLGAIKQSEQYDQVEQVIHDMAADGFSPNVVTYNTLMAIYVEQGRQAEALSLLEEIQRKGLSPTPASYCTALLAYQRAEDGFGALNLFVQVRDKLVKGDIRIEADCWETEFPKLEDFARRIFYQVMRRWLVKDNRSSANVLKLLSDMGEAGIQFDRSEYERLAWACTREEHHPVVKELYSRIRKQHSEISISVCNHMIWLMGKAKKWWAALEIYEDLLDKGPKPNIMSYELIVSHFNILLTAAKKRGIWRWGVRLLNKMEEKGIKPSSKEWNAVLIACSKASEATAAVQLFQRMIEKGEKPTIISYGALLSALEKGNLYDEAFRVWEHMLKVGLEPNVYAYTIMASVCVGQGKFNLVDSIIREMISSGIEPSVVTFNAIISGCAKKGMGSMAYEWFHRMKVQKIDPNEVTYEMLIEALTKDAKPRIAYELYLKAQNHGLSLSTKTYDAIIQSSQSYDASIDVGVLGPRPLEKQKTSTN